MVVAPSCPDLQLPSTSPNSGPRMFLLSSNFLFAFGLDSVPPRLWEALHLSFSSEERFLPWIQHLQSHLWFSAYISGFLPPSPVQEFGPIFSISFFSLYAVSLENHISSSVSLNQISYLSFRPLHPTAYQIFPLALLAKCPKSHFVLSPNPTSLYSLAQQMASPSTPLAKSESQVQPRD